MQLLRSQEGLNYLLNYGLNIHSYVLYNTCNTYRVRLGDTPAVIAGTPKRDSRYTHRDSWYNPRHPYF